MSVALIRITYGTVQSYTVTDERGVHHLNEHVGQARFFISLVEDDGAEMGLWNGPTYDQAIIRAEEARDQFGVADPIQDDVLGGAA